MSPCPDTISDCCAFRMTVGACGCAALTCALELGEVWVLWEVVEAQTRGGCGVSTAQGCLRGRSDVGADHEVVCELGFERGVGAGH